MLGNIFFDFIFLTLGLKDWYIIQVPINTNNITPTIFANCTENISIISVPILTAIEVTIKNIEKIMVFASEVI